ncbi:MAG TPA: ABC transporter permease [Candidatus Limnocylindrales bacterium]
MNAEFLRLVGLVARRDYLRTVRRRGFVAGTLLLPLAMGLIFAIQSLSSSSFESTSGPVVVVDESAIPLAVETQVAPDVVVVSRALADQRLADSTISEYYLVPATWPAQSTVLVVQSSQPAGSRSGLAFARNAAAQSEVDTVLRLSLVRASGVPDSVLAQLVTPVNYQTVNGTGGATSDAEIISSFLVPYAFTLIFMLSIFITSGYLLQSVTEEKENRVVEILLSSIPALPLMAGKVLGLGLAGLTQVAIWVTTALVALPIINSQLSLSIVVAPITLVIAVVFFALGYMGYGAIYAAVGALSPGAREAQQYASVFGIIAVIPIVLLPVFLTDPGAPLVIALCLIPLTAPAAMLALLSSSASPPWLLLGLSFASQLLFVIVATIATGRIFRATLLLYGVRPSLRRIAGAVLARS